jgi:ribosomal protein S7
MSGKGNNKLRGRQAALAVVAKLQQKPEAEEPQAIQGFDALVAALENIVESRPDMSEAYASIEAAIKDIKIETETVDLTPLVEAISKIQPTVEFDPSPIVAAIEAQDVSIDLTKVEDELVKIRKAIEGNNQVLLQLVKAAKSSKKVIYDKAGRVSEIKITGAD